MGKRPTRWLRKTAKPVAAAVVVACLLAGRPAPPQFGGSGRPVGPPDAKTVSYRGYRFLVPRGWPVVDDTRHPRNCVRFDRHVIYLGPVGSDEICPSRPVGPTTESVLIQPGPALSATASTEDPVARQMTAQAPRIEITATFDSDPAVIDQILASAGLPRPTVSRGQPQPSAELFSSALFSSAESGRVPAPPLPPGVESYSGLGFDACAAPSSKDMRALLHRSWYRAIGIYIGGADRLCAQPNLTPAWVRAQVQAGWRLIPLYAGPQANFGQLVHPGPQARAAARDAVVQARRLGFGPQTPLYYDMEGFGSIWDSVALPFMSSWTAELHRLGYQSGVYSSGDSGIRDLAHNFYRHVYAMPDVIWTADWNGKKTVADKRLHHMWWHKRIHQFNGGRTRAYGRVALTLNGDYFDNTAVGQAYASTFTSQHTSAVNLPDGTVMVFYLGRWRQLWFDRYRPGSGWTRPARAGVRAWSVPSVVWTGSAVAVFYRGNSGRLWGLYYRENGRLIARGVLRSMGKMGLGPYVVSQASGVIDVFWRGSGDHLWHGQFSPGAGWSGPQDLGGDLRSPPSPVTSSPGCTDVFWRGPGNRLWMVSRGLGGTWSKPQRLGVTKVYGAPQATAQPTGGVEVYWTGSQSPGLREGFYSGQGGWRGPRFLGGQVQSLPVPVTAAGAVRVLWLGPGHRLYFTEHRAIGNWNALAWTRPASARLSWADSGPFTAVGGQGGTVRVFWRGWRGSLWTAKLTGASWSRAINL